MPARRPWAIDLYCGRGGSTYGLQQAGFRVLGVDIEPQPFYCGDSFIQADITELDLGALVKMVRAAFVAASPPCQRWSLLATYQPEMIHDKYPDLIAPTRERLLALGVPFVLENVPQAPLIDPVYLCGAMFPELRVYRRRGFEPHGFSLVAPGHPEHVARCVRNGYLPTPERPFMSVHGGKHSKAWQRAACEAMGLPWMAVPLDARGPEVKAGIIGICESIPPHFSRWVGGQALAQLDLAAAA